MISAVNEDMKVSNCFHFLLTFSSFTQTVQIQKFIWKVHNDGHEVDP